RWPQPDASANDRAAAMVHWAERQPSGLEALARVVEEIAASAAPADAGALARLGTMPGRLLRGVRFRGFEQRYLRYVAAAHGLATTPGLHAAGGALVPLAAIWIERRLIAHPSASGTASGG